MGQGAEVLQGCEGLWICLHVLSIEYRLDFAQLLSSYYPAVWNGIFQ